MIAVALECLENPTAERPSQWRASCTVAGRRFEAVSRTGAAFDLARLLVKAGLGEALVKRPGFEPCKAAVLAQYTVEEGPTRPVRIRPWRPQQQQWWRE